KPEEKCPIDEETAKSHFPFYVFLKYIKNAVYMCSFLTIDTYVLRYLQEDISHYGIFQGIARIFLGLIYSIFACYNYGKDASIFHNINFFEIRYIIRIIMAFFGAVVSINLYRVPPIKVK
ncbi:MAG: hypothetical protein MHPSP_003708, partial [Paramarteilia canceri]